MKNTKKDFGYKAKSVGFSKLAAFIILMLFLNIANCYAWNIGEVFKGMSTNVTKAGSYQDQAAGYYAAGGLSMRTNKTSFNPISITPPTLTMSCSGIDSYLGSFSAISSDEMVALMKNIGAQAKVYAFTLGLKCFAPQIENALKDLRNLAMDLNQFAKGDCEMTKAIFAATLPKDSAMRESVCKDMRSQSGHDYFAAGKNCRKDLQQKEAMQKAQEKDPELMLGDYNIFIKAAEKAGIPKDMRAALMSMTGTIVVRDNNVYFLDSLAKDEKSWITHLKGGEAASQYTCNDDACLSPTLQSNITISPSDSYQGKAKAKLDGIKFKLVNNEEFDINDITFLSSIGDAFPVYDYITLESISGATILESSSELIGSYALLNQLKEVVGEIRKAVALLRSKQVSDQHLVAYLKSLDQVQLHASEKWATMLTTANQIDKRARLIEQQLMARERG